MADHMMLANSRPARVVPASSTAIDLFGRSAAITRAQELVRRAAPLDTGVLIVAERGTDIESIGRELHARSRPPAAPWVAVECGATDAGALERDLFGPSVSQATDLESIGPDSRLAAARTGTMFLHDVCELPAALQARLARIARDGEVYLGRDPLATNVRFIASAPPSIDSDVRDHRFRVDLYRRLAASRIDVPPLRERSEDIAPIAERLLEELSAGGEQGPRRFSQAALAVLSALSWPGNIAELRAVIQRVLSSSPGGDAMIQVEHVLPVLQLDRSLPPFSPAGSLRQARLQFERDYIAAVLQHHGWKVAEAAQTLGIQRPNLYRKARQLGIPVTRMSEVVKQ